MPPDQVAAAILARVSGAAVAAGAFLPGPFGAASAIAGAALGIAADVVRAGYAPSPRIDRVIDPAELLVAMHRHWLDSALRVASS